MNWTAIRTVVGKDLLAVRRSKAVIYPMLFVPTFLLVLLPLGLGLAARSKGAINVDNLANSLPVNFTKALDGVPATEQVWVFVFQYVLAPFFLIVPLMVCAVLAADAFAGEKERKTLESLLHLPISDRDLFVAKLLTAFLPALAVSWGGFVLYAITVNTVAWPVMHRIFVPNGPWVVLVLWVMPAVAALGLGVMIRVSARSKTAQEANQLGGAVILPLIFLTMSQAPTLLLLSLVSATLFGAAVWLAALWLTARGAARFTRNQLAARL